jgi:hypothetical protein
VSHSCKNNENESKVFLESTKAISCESTKARFQEVYCSNSGGFGRKLKKGMSHTSNITRETGILAGKQEGLNK